MSLERAARLRAWYDQDEFQPYSIEHPHAMGGAFLIHGFLGSPWETRALAGVMGVHGYSVIAPLIPGMAADFARIDQVTAADWTDAIRDAWDPFARQHARRILVGYSLGGTLALHLAATAPIPPDLIILLAPFTRIGEQKARLLPIAKHVVRKVNFWDDLDFSNPGTREWFAKAMPGLDLDDPDVIYVLKYESGVSTKTIDRLRRIANSVRKAARAIAIPTVIIQGHRDSVVLARDTRSLAGSLPGLLEYHEIPGDHMLPFDAFDSWNDVRHLVERAVMTYLPARDSEMRP